MREITIPPPVALNGQPYGLPDLLRDLVAVVGIDATSILAYQALTASMPKGEDKHWLLSEQDYAFLRTLLESYSFNVTAKIALLPILLAVASARVVEAG